MLFKGKIGREIALFNDTLKALKLCSSKESKEFLAAMPLMGLLAFKEYRFADSFFQNKVEGFNLEPELKTILSESRKRTVLLEFHWLLKLLHEHDFQYYGLGKSLVQPMANEGNIMLSYALDRLSKPESFVIEEPLFRVYEKEINSEKNTRSAEQLAAITNKVFGQHDLSEKEIPLFKLLKAEIAALLDQKGFFSEDSESDPESPKAKEIAELKEKIHPVYKKEMLEIMENRRECAMIEARRAAEGRDEEKSNQ